MLACGPPAGGQVSCSPVLLFQFERKMDFLNRLLAFAEAARPWRAALVAGAVAAVLAAGCGPAAPVPVPAPASQPASRPALPEEALLGLAELRPPVQAPRNPPLAKLDPRVQQELTQAGELAEAGQLAAAIDRLERAVGIAPDDPRVRRALGMAYVRLPDRGKALASLRRAAEAAPDDVELQLMLSRLYAAQRQTDAALLALRTAAACSGAVAENPAAAEVLLRLGELLYREGHWTAALECFTTLGDWIDRHARRYEDRVLLKPLILRPEALLKRRAQALMLLRRPSDAAELLRRAYERDRADPSTAAGLVEALLAAGEVAEAEAFFTDMAAEPAHREQLHVLAEAIAEAGQDKSLPGRIWKAYRAGNPVNASLAVSLARAAGRLGAPDEAEAILQAALREKPADPHLAEALVDAHLRQDRPDVALRVLAELLAANEAAEPTVSRAVRRVAAARLPHEFEIRFADRAAREGGDLQHALLYVAGELALAMDKAHFAAEQFRAAARAKRDFLLAYEGLLDSLVRRKAYDEAEQLIERVRKDTSDGYFGHYLAGRLALARGNWEAAIAALNEARQRNENHVATVLALADAYERAGQKSEAAAAALQAAIALEPDNPQTYRRLFHFHVDRGDHRSARDVLGQLLRRLPDSLQGRVLLVELQMLTEPRPDTARLLEELRQQAPDDPDVQMLSIQAEMDFRAGRPSRVLPRAEFERAVTQIRRIIEAGGDDLRPRRLLAKVLALPGLHAEAAEAWKDLHEASGATAATARAYAASLVLAGQYAEAADVFRKIVQEAPADFEAIRARVTLLERLGRREELAEAARKGHEVLDAMIAESDSDLRTEVLRHEKLQLFRRAGQFDEAVAYVRQQAADRPGEDAGQVALALMLLDADRHEQLLPLLEAWLADETVKRRDTLRYVRILAHGKAGQIAEARQAALAWIAEDPDALPPRQALLRALVTAERHDEALNLLDGWALQAEGPATAPSTAPAPEPEPEAERPQSVLAWCRESIVRVLAAQGKFPEALDRVDRYLRDAPQDIELLNLKATCLAETERREESIRCLEQVRKLTPDDAGANNNLGYTLADMGVRLDEAERMIALAVAIKPDQMAYLDSLAWVYYKTGRVGRAAAIFAQILTVAEDEDVEHPVILDHAGDAFYRLGWTERAAELWQRAIDRARKDKDLVGAEVRELLRAGPEKIQAVRAGKEAAVAPVVEAAGDDEAD